jgi:hypothetical protein
LLVFLKFSHHQPRLEFQTVFTRSFSQRFNTTMVVEA